MRVGRVDCSSLGGIPIPHPRPSGTGPRDGSDSHAVPSPTLVTSPQIRSRFHQASGRRTPFRSDDTSLLLHDAAVLAAHRGPRLHANCGWTDITSRRTAHPRMKPHLHWFQERIWSHEKPSVPSAVDDLKPLAKHDRLLLEAHQAVAECIGTIWWTCGNTQIFAHLPQWTLP